MFDITNIFCYDQGQMEGTMGTTTVTVEKTLPEVTQVTLRRLLTMEKRLRELERQYESEKAAILAAIEAGARIQPGRLTAVIQTFTRRIVQWREEFEKRLGKEEVERVLDATPPTVYKSLKIIRGGGA
jgi:hypothetical protein